MTVFAETITVAVPLYVAYRVLAGARRVMPKIGLFRAVNLALQSKLKPRSMLLTTRIDEMETIRYFANITGYSQLYMVILGPRGVGKTCLVNSVAERIGGTVNLTIHPGETSREIMQKSFCAIAGMRKNASYAENNAALVSFWYRLLFRRRLLLHMKTSERFEGEKCAALSGAVKILTRAYFLRVIVNATPNEVPLELLGTCEWVRFSFVLVYIINFARLSM